MESGGRRCFLLCLGDSSSAIVAQKWSGFQNQLVLAQEKLWLMA